MSRWLVRVAVREHVQQAVDGIDDAVAGVGQGGFEGVVAPGERRGERALAVAQVVFAVRRARCAQCTGAIAQGGIAGVCKRIQQGVGRQIRAGVVGHNGFTVDWTLPGGGFKQSGIGREGGVEGMEAYIETKTMHLRGAPTVA